MSLYIASLNSGSNGNCYYVGNQHEAVLIDAGLSCRETELRMDRSGLFMNTIKAVFISHEHSDHTRGAAVLARKYKLPVYLSPGTHNTGRIYLDRNLVRYFEANTPVIIGGLAVNAFPKQHDAKDPFSFTVSGNGITIGVLTDLGTACDHVKVNFNRCHAVFLEANYDEDMLENGPYPEYLKTRIRSDQGHLSNIQALELFTTHRPDFMSHVILSHLSQDNNNPRLVQELFMKHAGGAKIVVASRHQESPVFHVTGGEVDLHQVNVADPPMQYVQPRLF